MICSNCQHKIDGKNQFCDNCGAEIRREAFSFGEGNYVPKYLIDFTKTSTIDVQIRAHFFKTLEMVVEEDIGVNEYRKYFDQFYKSNFYKNFDLRTAQLAEELVIRHSSTDQSVTQKIDQILSFEFFAFIDHFLVLHCKKLHGISLPETLLKYAKTTLREVNLQQMILDYLDFGEEVEKVYTNLMLIPPAKIKNAVESFVFASTKDKIFFICDQTVFGSCKEGFAMTESSLYWKSHFNPPQEVAYRDLKEIKKDAEWINVNGQFFNVNKSINLKMLKLLKRIKRLYEEAS